MIGCVLLYYIRLNFIDNIWMVDEGSVNIMRKLDDRWLTDCTLGHDTKHENIIDLRFYWEKCTFIYQYPKYILLFIDSIINNNYNIHTFNRKVKEVWALRVLFSLPPVNTHLWILDNEAVWHRHADVLMFEKSSRPPMPHSSINYTNKQSS